MENRLQMGAPLKSNCSHQVRGECSDRGNRHADRKLPLGSNLGIGSREHFGRYGMFWFLPKCKQLAFRTWWLSDLHLSTILFPGQPRAASTNLDIILAHLTMVGYVSASLLSKTSSFYSSTYTVPDTRQAYN